MYFIYFHSMCADCWRSTAPNASNKYKCLQLKIIFNKCHLKVNKTLPPASGWVTDNEPNKINWEPIKTNIVCCELHLLAKERQSKKERKTRVFEWIEGVSSAIFVGGSLLGGIIYCFQTPTGFITYSSYYLVELWRTHKDSFCWQNTGSGRTSEVGKKRGRKRREEKQRGELGGRDKGKDNTCGGTTREKQEWRFILIHVSHFLFSVFKLSLLFCLQIEEQYDWLWAQALLLPPWKSEIYLKLDLQQQQQKI